MDIVAKGAPDGTNGGSVIRFLTNPVTNSSNPSERLRITRDGNIAIRTTNPASLFSLGGIFTPSTNSPLNYTPSEARQSFFNTYYANSESLFPQYLDIVSYGQPDGTNGGSIIRFLNNPVTSGTATIERLRITAAGYLKASNTGSYGSLTSVSNEFNSNQADWTVVLRNTQTPTPYGHYVEYVNAAPNSTGSEFLYCRDSSAVRFRIGSNGNAYNTTGVYTSGASDIRYKEQIVDSNSQWNDIKNIKVVNFKFIKDVEENGDDALKHIGFIAQQVEEVSPNLIEEMSDKETGETWKTIKTSIIHIKAIKALQEAMEKIEALEEKVKQLELK